MVPLDSGFLLIFDSNIWPNSAPVQDIMLRDLALGDLDFDLQGHLKSYVTEPLDPLPKKKTNKQTWFPINV